MRKNGLTAKDAENLADHMETILGVTSEYLRLTKTTLLTALRILNGEDKISTIYAARDLIKLVAHYLENGELYLEDFQGTMNTQYLGRRGEA